MSENDRDKSRADEHSCGASQAAVRRRAAVQESLARAYGPDVESWLRRASRSDVPLCGRGEIPRCCRNCVYANPLRHGGQTLQVCVNTPGAQGFFAIVDPCGVCPRFREPPAEVVRGVPPKCVDKGARYISLTKGLFTIVDPADFEWLSQHRWHAMWSGAIHYAGRKEHGASLRMHREIMQPPKGMVVHHINGNGLDNRRANLRVCTQADNIRSIGPQAGSSRYKGVWFDRANNKWVAGITVGHQTINLGRFESEVEAAKARDRKAFELWGEVAYLNFPEESLQKGEGKQARGRR